MKYRKAAFVTWLEIQHYSSACMLNSCDRITSQKTKGLGFSLLKEVHVESCCTNLCRR